MTTRGTTSGQYDETKSRKRLCGSLPWPNARHNRSHCCRASDTGSRQRIGSQFEKNMKKKAHTAHPDRKRTSRNRFDETQIREHHTWKTKVRRSTLSKQIEHIKSEKHTRKTESSVTSSQPPRRFWHTFGTHLSSGTWPCRASTRTGHTMTRPFEALTTAFRKARRQRRTGICPCHSVE